MVENLSLGKLKFAYFLVTKRRLLKKIFIAFLIAIDLLIWLLFFNYFTIYLKESKDFKKIEEELSQSINYQEIHQIIYPLSPEIIKNKILFLGRGKYNLICLIKNSNKNWFLRSFDYNFIWQGDESMIFQSFLLPLEEKYLIVFNQSLTQTPINFSCQIKNLKWQRFRQEKINFLETAKKFVVKDLKHYSGISNQERDITTFKFTNQTIYNFWQINLIAVLYQGREEVAIEKISLDKIKSQEERVVKIIWPSSFSFVSEVKIIPEANLLDFSSFMP